MNSRHSKQSANVQQMSANFAFNALGKSSLYTKQIQNGLANGLYYQQLTQIDLILSCIIVVHLLLLHCYFQLDVAANSKASWFLFSSFICGIFSLVFVVLKHHAYNLLYQINKEQLKKEGFKLMSFKLAMFSIMPTNFTDQVYMLIQGQTKSNPGYKLNYLLIMFATCRIAYSLILVLARSKYLTPRSNRICTTYGAYPGIMFCIRSIFKDYPFFFITSIFLISVLVFSFAFRISEYDMYSQTIMGTYGDMIWMTIITMSGVGYGDYTPETPIGRLVGSLCVYWGVLIVSVMVVVLTNTFSLTRNEWQSLTILKKLQSNTRTRNIASQYIRQSLWRVWTNYRYKLSRDELMAERKLKLRFRLCRRLNDMHMVLDNDIDIYNQMSRQFERANINLSNLKSNNLMIINYLNEEYIFKKGVPPLKSR